MKLLHVDASVLGDASVSRRISAAIAARFAATHPGIEVVRRDLAAAPLPHIDAALVAATRGPNAAAPRPAALAGDFAGGKRIVVASLRGGVYTQGPFAAADQQETYLRTLFGFLGVPDPTFVRVEGVAKGQDVRDTGIAAALPEAAALAA